MTAGGARKGAGRPKGPVKVAVTIRLTRAELKALRGVDPSPEKAVRALLLGATRPTSPHA